MEIEENEIGKRRTLSAWLAILIFAVGFLICMAFYATVGYGVLYLLFGEQAQKSGLLTLLVTESCMLLAVLTPILLLFHFQRIPFSDLGLSVKGHIPDIGYGVLAAVLIYIVGFGLSLILGEIEVTGFRFEPLHLLGTWVFCLLVAMAEEIMMRGYVLGRLLGTRLNKFLSLFFSAALFALLHVFNPGVAFVPMLNLLLAGMLLGASFLYTRNLCFPIALHLFWNWIQGPVLGYQVSGNSLGNSLLALRMSEKSLLNGGDFGFEGSIICTVLMAICTIGIIWWGEKRQAIRNV